MQKSVSKIINYKISDIIGAEYNPRQLTEIEYEHLKNSLKRFGFVDPLIINTHKDRKNILIGGHQRLRVAKDLKYKEIPCVEVSLEYDMERELNIRLNKNNGSWDWDALANYFDVDDLSEWGFTEEELLGVDDFGEEFSLPDGEKPPFQQMTFTLADEQAEQIKIAIGDIKQTDEYKYCETMDNENSNGNALYLIVRQWAEQKK